jgi:signal transduction histidine kinase
MWARVVPFFSTASAVLVDLRPPSMIIDLEHSIIRIAAVAEHSQGYAADLVIDGDLSGISEAAAGDLLATLRETLSNVARHAEASNVRITVAVTDAGLTLRVVDNGRGVAANRTESGLNNLRIRAEAHRGTFEITSGAGSGTVATWQVPLDAGS